MNSRNQAYERRLLVYRDRLINLPIFNGVAGILAFQKLLKRLFGVIKNDKKFEYQIQAMYLLLCNRKILMNMLVTKYQALNEKKEALEVPLTLREIHLLQKLDSLYPLLNQTNLEVWIEFKQIWLKGKIPQLTPLIQKLQNDFLYRKNQLIQLQYNMRKFIIKLIEKTGIFTCKWNEKKLAQYENSLIILDFFLCFLELNSVFVADDSWINFERKTKITQITESPLSMDMETLSQMVDKINYHKLYSQDEKSPQKIK